MSTVSPNEMLEIIDRLKGLTGARNDSQLAKALGIPRSTILNWRNRGSMPTVNLMLEISRKVGRSLEWITTGQETFTPKLKAAGVQALRVREELGNLPLNAMDAAEDCLLYIKDATREERETIRRLIRGLKASPEVRTHLVGQLKLIDRLVEQEQPREEEAADPPSRAKAS